MRKLVIAALAATTLSTAAGAQTVTNGSFESGTNPGGFMTVGTGGTDITGWTVSSGSVDYIGSYWGAQNGARSIDLSGNGPGTLSQVISGLTVGQRYDVSFWLGGNFDGPPTPTKTLDVSAGGTTLGYSYTAPTANPSGFSGWERFNFAFVANAPTTTLSFASTTVGSPYGPALDNVSLSAVPEPASWALMIGGFGLAGVALRRRKAVAAFA